MVAYLFLRNLLFMIMGRVSILLFVVCIVWGCRKRPDPVETLPSGKLQISVAHVCGNEPMRLKDTWYKNAAGESFRINIYKYFLSNFSIGKKDGSAYAVPESYFLVDEAQSSSKNLDLNGIPEGSYEFVEFVIGVDSTRNVSGAQTGALDQGTGMFWDWNTGYIMAKLEGISPQSFLGDSSMIYHVGGFAAPHNSLKKVRLELPSPVTISKDKVAHIHMQGDALEWFQTPKQIRIAISPVAMTPEYVMDIADNYKDMFTITDVE